MIRSLYTAATGMLAQQLQIDTTSHNIANVNTLGFKKNRAEFADLLYQAQTYAGSQTSLNTKSPTGIEVGLGVRPGAISKIFLQGSPKETGNDLDVMITGNGFFQVQLPDGSISYSRNGAFKLDAEGSVVNADGYRLIPEITVPAGSSKVDISVDGIVSVQGPDKAVVQVGQIELAAFINPAGLHSMGDNLYIPTAASGEPVIGFGGSNGFGELRHGFVEMSNVQLVEEMTDLITGQRAYEANSKAITTSDEMLGIVNGLKR